MAQRQTGVQQRQPQRGGCRSVALPGQTLTVGNDKVGNLRSTSVFKSDNTDALLKALPSILPVAVRTLDDGSQEIISN